jgi:APA family basic amino acid/polyamine antiporter
LGAQAVVTVAGTIEVGGDLVLQASVTADVRKDIALVGAYLLYGRRFSVARRDAKEAEQAAAD